MANILIVSEKPSVGRAVARALGVKETGRHDGYMEGYSDFFGLNIWITWAAGHLVQMCSPDQYDPGYLQWRYEDLPILPGKFKYGIIPGREKQFQTVAKLMNAVGGSGQDQMELSTLSQDKKSLVPFAYVVNACDAGREGELIFRRIYEMSGSSVPSRRLWISSMEDSAIRDGFAHLKDGGEYQNLYEASVCRAEADWLIGMNATRAFTTKYFKRLVVGRVQTPTLAMLAERQDKIDGFVKEAYYTVEVEGGGIRAASGRISEEADSDALAGKCSGASAVVSGLSKVQKKSQPPKLYDLTTLQREANRFFGYTAQETLDTLQELYEAKLVTYPRTDSQYVTSDMERTVSEMAGLLPGMFPFLKDAGIGYNVGRVINNDKVSDHHAVLPTKEAIKNGMEGLSEKQRNIFCLVEQRLAQAVSGEYIYEETAVTVLCEGHEFHAKGRAVLQPGFKKISDAFRTAFLKDRPMDADMTDDMAPILEGLYEGMEIPEIRAGSRRHFTSPPEPYSEDTLLSEMERAGSGEFEEGTERKGLGTPATRASILEKLIASGYAELRGRQIFPTADGRELAAVIPDYLKSAAMTAEWENRLLLVEKGQLDGRDFMQGITELICAMLKECDAISAQEQQRFHPKEAVGGCPVCGNPVYEGKKSFYCSSRECPFSLWKENRYLAGMGKRIDKKMAADLLENGRTHAEDFYSQKKGRAFAADLLMGIKDGRASFSMEFPKNKAKEE